MTGSDRRGFLARLAGLGAGLLAGLGIGRPTPAAAAGAAATAGAPTGPMPRGRFVDGGMPVPPPGPLPEEFWQELRREFLIPPDEAFFNTGTLGSSPRVVLDAVLDHMTHVERDIAHWDYKPDHEQFFTGYAPETALREKIAGLINATADEIALTQNATFGMNFLAAGLELGPGDEVVVMEGAHPGGRGGFELLAARRGAVVRFVPVPAAPASPGELLRIYDDATTGRTRVWMIPHLTSGTAILFPVDAMCRRASERGIVSVIDGAQTFGHLRIDVRAMGCDAYFTSPHKWLLAPVGTGFLYVRSGLAERLWPTLASAQWDNREDHGFRLLQYGTGNLSLLVGLDRALDFHAAIGPERVERRIVGLADRLRAGLAAIPGVRILSATHPAMRTATTIWTVEGGPVEGGLTPSEIQDRLWRDGRVRVRDVGAGVRQCCHIYTLEADVDRSLELTRALVRG